MAIILEIDREGRRGVANPALKAKGAGRGKRKCIEMGPMKENLVSGNERRQRQRYPINAQVTLFVGGREIPGYTRDLSNRGIYFFMASNEGAEIDPEFDFMIELPPEITLSTYCQIKCRARTVRTENGPSNFSGVAAEILEYTILREPVYVV